jgi:hypothetical protein
VEFVGFYRHAPTAEYRVLCHNIHYPYKIYEYTWWWRRAITRPGDSGPPTCGRTPIFC